VVLHIAGNGLLHPHLLLAAVEFVLPSLGSPSLGLPIVGLAVIGFESLLLDWVCAPPPPPWHVGLGLHCTLLFCPIVLGWAALLLPLFMLSVISGCYILSLGGVCCRWAVCFRWAVLSIDGVLSKWSCVCWQGWILSWVGSVVDRQCC